MIKNDIIKQLLLANGDILISLKKNTIENENNYSVVSYSLKRNLELSRQVFDTLRKAKNKFNKEIKLK